MVYQFTGFGFLSAATTAANLQNRIYAYLCTRNGDSGQPEYRVNPTLSDPLLSLRSANASLF